MINSRVATMPPAPDRAFASDNAAGAHPAVIQAVVAANHFLPQQEEKIFRDYRLQFHYWLKRRQNRLV